MSNRKDRKQTEETYLSELPDGAGCTEIWEHLSEQRDE
jgi:hypothetical protein